MSPYELFLCIICSNTDLGSKQLCQSHFGAKIPIYGLDLGKTSYKDLVFARREFLSVVVSQNESLRLIIIYYIKIHIYDLNNFARFTSEPKTHQTLDLGKTNYKDLVFVRSDLIRIYGVPNESLRLVIIHFTFKYSFRIKTSFLESLRSQKTRLKDRFRQNQL